MSDDKIIGTYIPHLAGKFRQAEPVLFTGAGFSLDAKNLNGTHIPSYDDLCREIWSLCFPGERYEEGSSLQDLFEDARMRHRSTLTQVMTQTLTVDAHNLPDFYRVIYSMPWSRCYTLNVDDLEEAAARAFELPRKVLPLSSTARTSSVPSTHAVENLEVWHLNGCLSDLPDNVTFSVRQYAERLTGTDQSYLRLISDLMTRPVVFIGTSLDEPSLWQHLELRKFKGPRGHSELRPRSYLVTPTLPRARRSLLAAFNTAWLPMTVEEFCVQILSRLQADAKQGLSLLAEQSRRDRGKKPKFTLVSHLAINPTKKTDYLIGQEPDWSDIQSGRAIERKVDAEIVQAIEEILKIDGIRGLVIITGTAGSGKSTALMRIVLTLTAGGTNVAWVDRDSELSPRAITNAMQAADAPCVLAIDDADMYGSELSPLARTIARGENCPLVLLEVRSGNMDRVVIGSQLQDVPIKEIVMPHLADQDVRALIDVLDRENRLGVLKGLAKVDQIKAFKEQANRQLLVAMYQATSGRKFEDKIADELFELREVAQFIYALLAVASAHRFALSRDEIIIGVGDRSNTTLNEISSLVRRHLVVEARDGSKLRTRHRVIARVLAEALQKRGSIYDVLYSLILIGVAKTPPGSGRRERPYRLVRTFLNHELLFRMLDAEQGRTLYAEFESNLNWDSHYWLQRGSLEVEEGDLSLAENFLNQARSLAPDDPFIDNEWAYLLFKKAIERPSSAEAPERVEEATAILMGLIAADRAGNQYPYHVLGSQGLSWARRGISNERARGAYLRNILATVREGVVKFPHSQELRQLEEDLTREILGLAVPHDRRR